MNDPFFDAFFSELKDLIVKHEYDKISGIPADILTEAAQQTLFIVTKAVVEATKLEDNIDERNVGAELMAKEILKKLKHPDDGRFGSETANEIIDFVEPKDKYIKVLESQISDLEKVIKRESESV
jgi:hypothetical protein